MTWRDKLEIGLKEDAPFRRDNLPESQEPDNGIPATPADAARSPVEPDARQAAGTDGAAAGAPARVRRVRRKNSPM